MSDASPYILWSYRKKTDKWLFSMLGAEFPNAKRASPYLACLFNKSYTQTMRRYSIFFTILKRR
jgi:hypothetical protein